MRGAKPSSLASEVGNAPLSLGSTARTLAVRDLIATAGLENPAAPWRDATFSEFYEWGVPERMVRTDRWKYVHSRNDTHQLYDLQEDPAEQVNLALDPGHAELCRELNERVLAGWGLEEV